MDILIVYATKEGQTGKIADFIAEVIRHHDHQVTSLLCENLPSDFSTDRYNAAIIGGPVHMGKYPGDLILFVKGHLDWLKQVPTAFFTVCMAIETKKEKEQAMARAYSQNFIDMTHWQPNYIETFSGAIKYTQYGFITRIIMRQIAKKEGRDTDTSRDYEYTDWDKVTQFAEQFLDKAGI